MENSFQIHTLKSHIENIKLQIESIEMQNNNMMMGSQIKEQLLNLSIQLFNSAILVFSIGQKQNGYININNFQKQLNKILNEINLLNSNFGQESLNHEHQLIKQKQLQQLTQQQMIQQQMMQQQMMQQQMMQQQKLMKEKQEQEEKQKMMQQQMMQQQMIQQQMIQQQQMEIILSQTSEKEIVFVDTKGNNKKIKAKIGTTVGEILKIYINGIHRIKKEKFIFLYNAVKLNLDDKRKIEEVFIDNNKILVLIN